MHLAREAVRHLASHCISPLSIADTTTIEVWGSRHSL